MKSAVAGQRNFTGRLDARERANLLVFALFGAGVLLEFIASGVCHLIKRQMPLDEQLALAAMACFVCGALIFAHRNVKDRMIIACLIGASALLLCACVLDVTGALRQFADSALFGGTKHLHKMVHDITLTAGLALLLVSFGMASLQAYRAQRRLELQNEELRRETKSRVLLATAIEQSDESIVITDPQGVIEYANPAFEALTGYGREELIGQTTAFFRGGGSAHMDVWRTITRGETWRGHLINRRKDGTEYEVRAVISCVFGEDGKIVNYIGAQHDVTLQMNLERQLLQAQKMEALGMLAGRVAHDFNNILALILGHSEMMLRQIPDQDPVRRHVERIEKAGRRATKLVKQMLAFSRQAEQKQAPITVHRVVREAADLFRASLPPTIEFREAVADCGTVMADSTQIHQVVMNLCTNAYQALKDRKGILEVTLDEVEIGKGSMPGTEKLSPGHHVRLTVRDTGNGIDPSVLPHIFDPFFTTRNPGEGTGLGLSTVHGIVASHRGAVVARSEAGRGSTFEVYLPRLDDASQTPVPEQEPPAGGCERVLLVDDSEEIAEMAGMALEQMGYSVSSFTDSLEALDVFRNAPQEYDIIVTDQVMPGMTGTEFAREILALRPGLPVILISGFGQELNPEAARIAGISECLMKPFAGRALNDAIRRAFDGKTSSAGA